MSHFAKVCLPMIVLLGLLSACADTTPTSVETIIDPIPTEDVFIQDAQVITSLVGQDPIAEMGRVSVNQLRRDQWRTINLRSSFDKPVVIMQPASFNGGHALIIRLRNVQANSFEFQLQEWAYLDGPHTTETISYLVVEEGQHELAGGLSLEVGSLPVSNSFKTVAFKNDYEAQPVVLTQTQTVNEAEPVLTRQKVTPNGFAVRLQEDQASNGAHSAERVAYVVARQGSALAGASQIQAALTPNRVNHRWYRLKFDEALTTPPILLASMQTSNGLDPAGLRYRNLNAQGADIFVEEERSKDREIAHAAETVGFLALTGVSLSETPANPPPSTDNYADNLNMIKSASVRNRNHDSSSFQATAMADLPVEQLYGPRSDYLDNPGGNPEPSFPVEEGGQFRTACEFSHFSYDDPIVHPNKPGAAHLHMFWGNTDVNAFSTYDTLRNRGSSTCNGQELNRTGYWAPAMFDAEGNVRIPERIIIYYKGYGLANGRSEVYPPRAAMVTKENLHEVSWNEGGTAGPDTGEFSFICSNQWRGDRNPASNTIPECNGSKYFDEYGVSEPHVNLEMHVKFPNCWNRKDASNPDNWGLARVGGWFYSECEERATFPNIEYIIAYPLEIGETTEGWYLSSDVNHMQGEQTVASGASVHADWWGAWHPEINQTWIDNCVNFKTDVASGCGMGYLSDGGPDNENPYPGPALKFRPQFEGPIKVPAATLFAELCGLERDLSNPAAAAHCRPAGH